MSTIIATANNIFSFWNGFSSIFFMSNRRITKISNELRGTTDTEKLKNDWLIVGKDFCITVNKQKCLTESN